MGQQILVADSHPVLVKALAQIIEHELGYHNVMYVQAAGQIMSQLKAFTCSHLILDHSISRRSFGLIESIVGEHADLLIMILANDYSDIYLQKYPQYGIREILSKTDPYSSTVIALRKFLGQVKEPLTVKQWQKQTPFSGLTKRENEILKHFLNGFRGREIAELLALRPNTISGMKARIHRKTNTGNLRELIDLAKVHKYHSPIPDVSRSSFC